MVGSQKESCNIFRCDSISGYYSGTILSKFPSFNHFSSNFIMLCKSNPIQIHLLYWTSFRSLSISQHGEIHQYNNEPSYYISNYLKILWNSWNLLNFFGNPLKLPGILILKTSVNSLCLTNWSCLFSAQFCQISWFYFFSLSETQITIYNLFSTRA